MCDWLPTLYILPTWRAVPLDRIAFEGLTQDLGR